MLPLSVASGRHPWAEAFNAARRRLFLAKADVAIPDSALRAAITRSDDELGFTDNVLREACRSALGTLPERIVRSPIQGTFHRVFIVHAPDGALFALRVAVFPGCERGLSLLAEKSITHEAIRHGIPAPNVIAVDVSRAVFPFEFQLVEALKGRTMRDFDADEKRSRALLEGLAESLRRVHQINCGGYGLIGISSSGATVGEPGEGPLAGVHARWRDYITTKLVPHIRCCQKLGAISGHEVDAIQHRFDDFVEPREAVRSRLLHGDPGGHNVVSRDGASIDGLLDWEDALAGDPLYDIAMLATFHPERRHDAIWRGYGFGEALPEQVYRRFWTYFLRIALAKAVHRHRFGYPDLPGRIPAASRIRLALLRLDGR
ncbi:MAG: phosphotransferase family protein [Gammaproteobacteria bacterium]